MKDREFHLNAADRREIEAMEHAIAIGIDFRDLFGEIDDAAWDKALSLAGIKNRASRYVDAAMARHGRE